MERHGDSKSKYICFQIIHINGLTPFPGVRELFDTAMKDPRLQGWDLSKMPFDGKRMIFGGFNTIVEL